jgi:hypothetical protein
MQPIPVSLDLPLAPAPTAPARARAAVSAWLASGHGRSAPFVEIALLLVSELVTNGRRRRQRAPISSRERRLDGSKTVAAPGRGTPDWARRWDDYAVNL